MHDFSFFTRTLFLFLIIFFSIFINKSLKTTKIYQVSPPLWKTGYKQSYQGFKGCVLTMGIVPKMKHVCRGIWKTGYKQSYQGFRGGQKRVQCFLKKIGQNRSFKLNFCCTFRRIIDAKVCKKVPVLYLNF